MSDKNPTSPYLKGRDMLSEFMVIFPPTIN